MEFSGERGKGYMNLSHGFFFPVHGKILESMSLHAPLEKRECHVPGEEDSPDVGWYGGKCISHATDDDIFEYGRAFEVRRLVRRVAPEVTVPHELKWKCEYCNVVNGLDQYLSCFVLSRETSSMYITYGQDVTYTEMV